MYDRRDGHTSKSGPWPQSGVPGERPSPTQVLPDPARPRRSVADRLLNVACALRDRTFFDPQRVRIAAT